jgi:diguanylate cyclase (GGDEF)-like protein
LSIDVLTCYVLTGAGSLIGLGLMQLSQTDEPRIAYALRIFRWAFGFLSVVTVIAFVPNESVARVLQPVFGFSAVGVALLAWAFRQLNGRRTPPWLGLSLALASGVLVWGAAAMSSYIFLVVLYVVVGSLSLGIAVDQGLLIRSKKRKDISEICLMVTALLFSLIWVLMLVQIFAGTHSCQRDWLCADEWLRPIAGLSFALLPLAVASLAFSTINTRLMQKLKARALSDELTGCLSRRGLNELGSRMLALQNSPPAKVAVLMLDLDHFKAINDQYGHIIGDKVLCHVTQVVRERLRDDALFARYGGEEFTILLPVQNVDEVKSIAERLRQAVEKTPCKTSMGKVPCTVSIGVSFHSPHSSLEEDLIQADKSLYVAKSLGRNRVEFSDAVC